MQVCATETGTLGGRGGRRESREADTQTSQQTDIFFSLGAHYPLASRRKRRGIRLAGALRFFACRQKGQGRH